MGGGAVLGWEEGVAAGLASADDQESLRAAVAEVEAYQQTGVSVNVGRHGLQGPSCRACRAGGLDIECTCICSMPGMSCPLLFPACQATYPTCFTFGQSW